MDEQAAVCFKLGFFILTLSVVHTTCCPNLPLWDARAKTFCKDPSWYHCLENQAGDIKEICITPKYISKGHYPVIFIGGQELGERSCPSSHYQPNGQMSNLYKSVTCMYMKDICGDDGEEPCDDGSDVSDRTCRCDYTRGYRASEYLLSNPQLKSCYQPKSEFKGCVMLQCEKGKELNKAYQCKPACPPGYYKPNFEARCVPDILFINSSTSTESVITQTQTEKSMEKEISVMKDQVSNGNSATLAIAILCLIGGFFVAAIIYFIRSKIFLIAYQRCRSRHDSGKFRVPSFKGLKQKEGEKLNKKENNAYRYADVDAIHKQDIGKRIGCIRLKSHTDAYEYGTGFRVGERYVMTAYHVVQGVYDPFWKNLNKRKEISAVQPEEGPCTLRDIIKCLEPNEEVLENVKKLGMQMVTEISSIRFGYLDDKKPGTTFKFKYDVPFISKEHDFAILELLEEPSKPWPVSIDLASVCAPTMPLNILGHPGGRELQTDPACKIICDESELNKTIKDSVKFFSSLDKKISIDRSDFSKCKISHDQILFHCSKSTAHGASGSPLIQNVNDHPEVIGMLLEGYPKIYYNKFRNNKKANKHPELLIESGISMEKVKSLLQKHKLTELSKNIFTQEN